ncbi:hypothetical protein EYF80_043568 [Liparis tanakae]|uniref:Uncharacterized protein n=1 Tax=Liparis tanakae TaxID=230148 RepID=A0A4Z2FY44_9TELE|nr:hypothetical protein EYF80_043568 [Liparis tanakae]
MGRPNARYMERQMDGARFGSSGVCVERESRWVTTQEAAVIAVDRSGSPAAHPLVLVGVFEPEVDERLQEANPQVLQIFWRFHLLGVGVEHVFLRGEKGTKL